MAYGRYRHTHSTDEVAELQAALDSKLNLSGGTVTGEFRHAGATLGFYGAAGVTRAPAITDRPTGLNASASENANAINAILAVLRDLGLVAE